MRGYRGSYRRGLISHALLLAAVTLSACSGGSHALPHRSTSFGTRLHSHAADGVAYVVGASTDPDGNSKPRGLGVATGIVDGRLRAVERRTPRGPFGLTWLGNGRLLASEAVALTGTPAELFAFRKGELARLPAPPLHPGDNTFAWSSDGKLIAVQPWIRVGCGAGARAGCSATRAGRTIYVERGDGSARRAVGRGLLRGWTPHGRLLIFSGLNTEFASGAFMTLDPASGGRRTLLSSRRVGAFAHRPAQLADLAYSGDGRYVAARVVLGAKSFGLWGVVIADANGRILRVITSRNWISMFAWSPRGHALVYTTSGFPAPHELYLLSSPSARQRRILSQGPHFDWVTWSPDGRWLLIDNEQKQAWELLHLIGRRQTRLLGGASVPIRRLRRLGAMPLWCCPQQRYGGS